jgi:hypothetical protein
MCVESAVQINIPFLKFITEESYVKESIFCIEKTKDTVLALLKNSL